MGSRQSKRYKSSRIMLEETGDELYADCHWCGITCVWWQKIPRKDVIGERCFEPQSKTWQVKLYGGMVRFWQNGEKKTMPYVSVDHLVELAKGGSKDRHNLVLSCVKCNAERSNPPQRTQCHQCGGPFDGASSRSCRKCLDKWEAGHSEMVTNIITGVLPVEVNLSYSLS